MTTTPTRVAPATPDQKPVSPAGRPAGRPMPDDLAAQYASMWRIRLFEDAVMDLFSKNLVRGSTHLAQGQEAVSVGVCAQLDEGDTMTCTYRGHAAILAMGAPLDRAFAEILGRRGGLCGGKGGSMHLTDVSVGALGSNAIVGAHLPTTVGAAFAAHYRGSDRVAVAFFGDGSTNIGAFHESLNLAATWRLPAVFVLENNQYGEYSPVRSTTAVAHLVDRAAAYGMVGVSVDGQDVEAVGAVAAEAVRRARAGEGPTLIEADTYRYSGHSRSDPGAYRPPGELDQWRRRDPLVLTAARLAERGVDGEQIEAAARADVTAARDRALSWPAPEPAERFEDVWA